jgi:hypothetical protein
VNRRVVRWAIAVGLAYAGFVTLTGGGVDDPATGTPASADGSGVNPHAGQILGRCVVLQGTAWSAPTGNCAQVVAAAEAAGERVVVAAATPSPGAGTYSMPELEQLWRDAGGDPSEAHLAAAIAMAESGGRSDAVGHNPNGTVDRGLWQVNSIHGAGSTLDPADNARAAVAISRNGTNFTPWVTFTHDKHLRYL